MKTQTMIDYLRTNLVPVVVEGWRSKAAFEVAAQVRLDSIVRTHLSSKVGLADTDKDGAGVLVQKVGGYSLVNAISFDSYKLEKQKEYDDKKFQHATASRRRYWVIMIAVSMEQRGDLKNTSLTVEEVPSGKYTVAIGIKDV